MMATEVNQTYFAWSQGKTTELDGSQGVSVSQTFDHGSISFGRFELESLSWEKRSVFTNDRRHEEFGKFNGLVAQKKAYFEEYYKRIRELKASQQQNQQTELILEYCGDGSDSSQTGEEHTQAEELETPTGSSGTVVCDYVEQAAQVTTSEQEMQCYDDHEEFSSSNLFSSAGISQQADQNTRENVSSGNSDSVDDIVQKNASSGLDRLAAAFENATAPKRIIDKDFRLRYASKIIPKSVKTLSDSPLDRTSVSKRTGSAKASTTINQKTKTDNVRSLHRPNAAPQKLGTTRTHSLTSKEALGVTGVRRPSSAAGRRPSTGERHPITRATVQKPSDASTPRRPSTAERHPVARERAQKQGNVTTPCRPSTSERRPVNQENAGKHAYIATACRPSTGDRHPINRDSVLKLDPRMHSKTTATVAHPRGATTTVGILKKASSPNATKSSKFEPESDIKGPKGPSRSKRMDMHVAGKQKSRSVNLPSRKLMSSSIGESALETIARTKKKEGISATVQSRASTLKRTTPSQTTGSTKGRTPNPPPPPPPRRPSRATSKPNAGDSSVGGRKAKASAPVALMHAKGKELQR